MYFEKMILRMVAITAIAFLGACSSQNAKMSEQAVPAMDMMSNYDYKTIVKTLAGDDFGGRGGGYPGEEKAARYLANEFRKLGLKPIGDDGSYLQHFSFYPRHPPKPWLVLHSQNILGFLEGSDPVLKREIIVIGAHYDGQGQSGEADPFRESSDAVKGDNIWNSANDDATGASAVLAIARAIVQGKFKTDRSIVFALFGAEEFELIGSNYYVSHPPLAWSRHVAMMQMEKLGRNPEDPLITLADGTSADWSAIKKIATELSGTKADMLFPELTQDSDHYGFAIRGVPAIALGVACDCESHLASDTWDKIDYGALATRSKYALAMTMALANRPGKMKYTVPPGELVGLGTVTPTAEELHLSGIDNTHGGIKVVSVVKGGPAYSAGLRAGDLIVSVNNMPLDKDADREKLHQVYAENPDSQISVGVIRDFKAVELMFKGRGK